MVQQTGHLRKPRVLTPLRSLRLCVRNEVELVPLACEDVDWVVWILFIFCFNVYQWTVCFLVFQKTGWFCIFCILMDGVSLCVSMDWLVWVCQLSTGFSSFNGRRLACKWTIQGLVFK